MAVSNESIERDPDEESEPDSLTTAMEELCEAFDKKDYSGAAAIFRSAFELMEEEPHIEGPHTQEP